MYGFKKISYKNFSNKLSSGSGGGTEGAMAPPGPVKIGHKKDGRQRRPHRFHVSRPPPYPAAGSATETKPSLADKATEMSVAIVSLCNIQGFIKSQNSALVYRSISEKKTGDQHERDCQGIAACRHFYEPRRIKSATACASATPHTQDRKLECNARA